MTSKGHFWICVQNWCILYKYCFIDTFIFYLYNFHNCDQESYDNIQYRKYINGYKTGCQVILYIIYTFMYSIYIFFQCYDYIILE